MDMGRTVVPEEDDGRVGERHGWGAEMKAKTGE